jgi:hypothetical protein
MSKVKFVSPSGKIVELGAKALNSTSLRQMGFKPYEEVYAAVPEPKQSAPTVQSVLDKITPEREVTFSDEEDIADEQPKTKRGRPRKNTMSDADQA